jgi:hypothetical protein
MKIKNLILGLVLVMLVVCSGAIGSAGNSAQAFGCHTFCANAANACMSECNGDPTCENQCRADFDCCNLMCQGRGTECI